MAKLGAFIAFLGWVTSIQGYTLGHLFTIALGLAMIIGDHYLARR